MCNYKDATGTALDLWSRLYGESLSITLTDTFSTEVFYRVRVSRHTTLSVTLQHP